MYLVICPWIKVTFPMSDHMSVHWGHILSSHVSMHWGHIPMSTSGCVRERKKYTVNEIGRLCSSKTQMGVGNIVNETACLLFCLASNPGVYVL